MTVGDLLDFIEIAKENGMTEDYLVHLCLIVNDDEEVTLLASNCYADKKEGFVINGWE